MPFRGDTSALIFKAILDGVPPPPIRLNPDLPPKLEDILNKSLEKDRNLRYQHAADIRADLQRPKRDSDSGRAVTASSGRVDVAAETISQPSAPPSARISAPISASSAAGSSVLVTGTSAAVAPTKTPWHLRIAWASLVSRHLGQG